MLHCFGNPTYWSSLNNRTNSEKYSKSLQKLVENITSTALRVHNENFRGNWEKLRECWMRHQLVSTNRWKKYSSIGYTVCIFSFTALGSVMEGILCINAIGLTLPAVLWPFCMMVTFLSMAVIYIGLVCKTKQIIELFAYLDHLIEGSKSFSFFFNSPSLCELASINYYRF